MSDPQETKIAAFSALLVAQARLRTKISEELEIAGQISLDVYDVLKALDDHSDDKMRMSELADKVLLSRSGLTRKIDRLEKLGYIVRTNCPDDRRGSFAELTDKGRGAHERAWPTVCQAITSNFGDRMTEGESRQLAALMKRIIEPLEKMSD